MSPNPFAALVNKARQRREDRNTEPYSGEEWIELRAARLDRKPLTAAIELPAGPAAEQAEAEDVAS